MKKKFLPLTLLFFLLTACQTWKIETRPGTTTPKSADSVKTPPSVDTVHSQTDLGQPPEPQESQAPTEEAQAPKSSVPDLPKIGVIFGPGLAYVYSQVGVLQELARAKMPIHAIAGLEWGSLVGALYAHKEQANDVEWQLSKLKNEVLSPAGSLFKSDKAKAAEEISEELSEILKNVKIENMEIPFSCLSMDLSKRQYFWIKKGDALQSLPYCLASYPLYSPFKNQTAGVDIKLAAELLRSRGAQYIVLINSLPLGASPLVSGSDSRDEALWALYQINLSRASQFVNYTIQVNHPGGKLLDASDRRHLIKLGREAGQLAAQKLSDKLGF